MPIFEVFFLNKYRVCLYKLVGVPVPAISSALNYFDSFRGERLSSNMIQAQRDYFGAHTYQRIDKEGVFHTDWLSLP